MNSLQQLNGFANTIVVYQDERPYSGTFGNTTNQSVQVGQGGWFIAPTGIQILDLVSAPNLTYSVNLSAVYSAANIVFTWPTVSGTTTTSGNGIYAVTGINTLEKWALITSPNVSLGNVLFQSNFSFSSNLADGAGNLFVWNTAATINPLTSIVTSYTYAEDLASNLSLAITDSNNSPSNSYTLVFSQTSPSVGSNAGRFISNGVYGNYGDNLTLTGTKSSINNTVVAYDPPPDYTSAITLNYAATKYIGNVANTSVTGVTINMTNSTNHNEYSSTGNLGSIVIREGRSYLNGFGILDQEDYPGERTYQIQFLVANTQIGRIYYNGISYEGNCTITGTKTAINANLSNTSSTYVLANNKIGSTTVTFNLTRTSPGPTVLASNVTANLATVAPTLGSQWQDGKYIGTVNNNYLVCYDARSSGLYRWVESYAPNPDDFPTLFPGNNAVSMSNGVQNTTNIVAAQAGYGPGGTSANWYTAVNTADSEWFGSSDWYLPAYDELYLAGQQGALSTGYAYWSSTVSAYSQLNIYGVSQDSTLGTTQFTNSFRLARTRGYNYYLAVMRRLPV